MICSFILRKILLVVFVIFTSLTSFSQDIRFIRLEFNSAVQLKTVKIDIFRNPDHTYQLKVKSDSLRRSPGNPIDQKISINREQFEAIVKSLSKIKQTDIINGPELSILDGTSCSISYGIFNASISYYANTPNINTEKRNLTDFLNAYKLILKTAALDPEKIL